MVEWVNAGFVRIAKHVDGQAVQPFDVWNLAEWCGKFYTGEVEFVLVGDVLGHSCVFPSGVQEGEQRPLQTLLVSVLDVHNCFFVF